MTKSVLSSTAIRSGIRFMISGVLLYVLLRLTNIDDVINALKRADIRYIAGAFLLLVFNLGFQILKWKYLLKTTGSSSLLRDALSSFLFGVTLGSLTPGQVGEFGGRALTLHARSGIVVGLTIIDKFQIFTIMSIAGVFSLVRLLRIDSLPILASAIAGVTIMVLLMIRPALLRRLLNTVGISRLKHRWVNDILDSLSLLSSRDLVITITLTILFYVTVYFQLLLLFSAFSFFLPVQVFLGYSAMMLLKSLLPISIADLGTRELGLVYFMSMQGIPKAVSFNASILLFSMNILIPALCGLAFFPKNLSRSRPSQHE